MKKINLIIVDDHEIIRMGIKSLLKNEEDIVIVAEGANGKEAVELVKEHYPDVVLIDILMPISTGIEATKRIKEYAKDVKVVMLTSLEDKVHLNQAMNVGANGYLSKEVGRKELASAIRAVTQGERVFSSTILSIMANPNQDYNYNSDIAPSNVYLSAREQEIVQLIADGMTSKEIGDKLFISPRTVETHRTNIMEKLHIKNTAGIVRFALYNLP